MVVVLVMLCVDRRSGGRCMTRGGCVSVAHRRQGWV